MLWGIFMEFYQLEYFQVIAEERSFSKASEVLHISQPALSRQIKALEEELKQQLFIRNGKSLTLTKYGQRLFIESQNIISNVNSLKMRFMFNINEQDYIKICTTPTISECFLPEFTKNIVNIFPKIKFKFDIRNTYDEVINEIASKNCEIAIVPDFQNMDTVEFFPLLHEKFVLVSSYKLANDNQEIVVKDLKDEPFILTKYPCVLRKQIDNRCKKEGFYPYTVSEVEDIHLIPCEIAAGTGISILPGLFVHNNAAFKNLHTYELDRGFGRNFFLAWNTSNELSIHTQQIINFLSKNKM
ncbi:hypothetical protein CN287_23305 [Bacillus cereus]|nr:hypothetical protein CN440_28210 [Bacillus cereus]PFC15997.1 hypothetical protein CN287_23305 [Bacillus cereus]